jgi:phosphoadenosine phosphosulfate reductase
MSADTELDGDLAQVSASFEYAHPRDVVAWAWERFGDGMVVTASFEDPVLVHIVAEVAKPAEVVLLDTQYLFAETHWYAQRLTRQLGLNLVTFHPDPEVQPDDLWQTDTEACCHVRKVIPLAKALAGRTAWITGVRRADGPTRANAPIVSWDAARNLVKINPLATLSDDDMTLYQQLHDLEPNPLTERGYPSIGCWPCTRPVAPGEDKRAGRWSGQNKTECGLHVPVAEASVQVSAR